MSRSGSAKISSLIAGSRGDKRGNVVFARFGGSEELDFCFFACGAIWEYLPISAKEYSMSSAVQIEATEKLISSRINISVLLRRRDEKRSPAISLAHIRAEKD